MTLSDLPFIFAFFLPVIAFAVFAVTVTFLIQRLRRRRWVTTSRTFLLLSLAGMSAAVWAFSYAQFWVAGFVMDAEDVCGFHDDLVHIAHRVFPVSARCELEGPGPSKELVPWWVNPTIVLGVLVSGVAFGGVVRTRMRQRGEEQPSPDR